MNTPKTALAQVWKRLEAHAAALWKDSSPRAVEAQALLEEYRAEMTLYDTLTGQSQERTRLSAKEHEDVLASLRAGYDAELNGMKRRFEILDKTIRDKDAEIANLLAALGESERKNAEFHAQVLKSAADTEEATAKKMETLYHELKDKEASLEAAWQKRMKTLEDEAVRHREILAAKQAELDAWEKRRLAEEESLKKRSVDVELRSQQLQQEYRVKQQEIEQLKESLQRSVTELVRQYQARLKGESAGAAA